MYRPVPVIGDPTLIALVLRNLLENVRKHTPTGTQAMIQVGEDGAVSFEDTGPGLPPRFRERDFARFARGSDDGRTGSGLDLSICETAMRRMGGTFRLDRSRGGCRFVMTFPKAPPHGDAPQKRLIRMDARSL